MSLFLSYSSPIFLPSEEGGMLLEHEGYTAQVYVTKIDGRRQLVKKLKPEFEHDSRYVALFKKEFEVGNSLHHPNLVVYHKFMQAGDGVMIYLDYIDGLTLEEVLETEPKYFTNKEHLDKFVHQLLSCISYLHEHQVLHLDLKPSNIMITTLNADVKVIDLGFCYSDTYNDTPGLDKAFAAPEQKDSDQFDDIDVRTDLYAVGRILEETEKAMGKSMPKRYHRLMLRCLETEKEKRPSSAHAALKMISKRSHITSVLATVLAAIVAVFGLLMLYAPTRHAITYAYQSIYRGEAFQEGPCHYHIISEEDATCELQSWTVPATKDKEKHDIVVDSVVSIKGKNYRVVAVADRAVTQNKFVRAIFIPEGVESIGVEAFSYCPLLSSIHLPSSIKEMGHGAFGSCKGISSVVLSPNLKVIPESAFSFCSLEHIEVPEGVEVLSKDCFAQNTKLKKVALPSTLKEIGRGVFYNCPMLKEVTIPAGVKTMGDFVFLRDPGLTDVYNYSPTPQNANELFDTPSVRVHVPKASLERYKAHPVWGQQVLIGDL